jgi:hypothetical protein
MKWPRMHKSTKDDVRHSYKRRDGYPHSESKSGSHELAVPSRAVTRVEQDSHSLKLRVLFRNCLN